MNPTHADGVPTSEEGYVLFRLGDQLYGVPTLNVAQLIPVPALRPVPESRPTDRGVFMLRDQCVLAMDLRPMIGLPSLAGELAEFRSMLAQREQDHRNWLKELEASVREARPFTLATDPHRCAFGKWYDAYESDSVLLMSHHARFDAPHKRIHALAREVGELVADGKAELAMQRINETRDHELSEMITIFAEFDSAIASSNREIAIVLSNDAGESLAFCVDSVESVHAVEEMDWAAPGIDTGHGTCAIRAGKHGDDDELVMLIDVSELGASSAEPVA